MHQLSLLLFVVLLSPWSAPSTDAHRILEETRLALAGGRDITPVRIEIDAIYRYAEDDQEIIDHTVIEPGRSLFQERDIAGKTIRRSWSREGAYLESPNGRIRLEKEMSEELEAYLCLRQLELLILCPGAEASKISTPTPSRRLVQIRQGKKSVAELEIDIETHNLIAIRYHQPLDSELADEEMAEMMEVRFSNFQQVDDGWMLPHQVETMADGKKRSSYSVKRWLLESSPRSPRMD